MKHLPAELLPCPSCRQPMAALCIAALPHGHLGLDYCAGCRGIWFDPHESGRLAPQSVLELFRIIRDGQEADGQPLAAVLACPRCRTPLRLMRDIARSGPIAYHGCPNGHGRFTPFAQFLTEKGFVRHIAKKEVEAIAAVIGQVSCHGCGGPIDLRRDTACPHCRAPIAVLDPEAMARTFASYSAKAAPRVRAVVGDLTVAVRDLPFLPRRRGKSLLDLGIGAVAGVFD